MRLSLPVRMLLLWTMVAAAMFGQQMDVLKSSYPGRVLRDGNGNWLIVQDSTVGTGLRVVKMTPDFSGTLFDRQLSTNYVSVADARLSASGNLDLAGTDAVGDIAATAGVVWPAPVAQSANSFLMELDAAGTVVLSTYVAPEAGASVSGFTRTTGGEWLTAARSCAVISASGITVQGSGCLVVLRISADGTRLLGGTQFGTAEQPESIAAIVPAPGENFFLAGYTVSDHFPVTAGAFQQQRPGGTCYPPVPFFGFGSGFPCPSGFVVKLDGADLHIVSSTYLGGTTSFAPAALAVDGQGFPYIAGTVTGRESPDSSFPTTAGVFQPVFPSSSSGNPQLTAGQAPVVVKMLPDLSGLAYSTFVAGTGNDTATSLLVDEAGTATLAGSTSSRDFPATGGFRTQCGPPRFNPPQLGFVTRLDAAGQNVTASAILDQQATLRFQEASGAVVASAGPVIARLQLDAGGPSVGCVVNGANFSRDLVAGPNQLLTLFGADIPSGAKVIVNGSVEARLLYSSPTQLNAVVPPDVAQGAEARIELDVDGVRSNGRTFVVRSPNPTVKTYITPAGQYVDRGNLLADVRLSDGSSNSDTNPARYGEVVTIYTTGVDLGLPVDVTLAGNHADLIDTSYYPGSFDSVAGLKVRVPNACCGGVEIITIKNGPNTTLPNAGYVWVF